MLNIEILSPAGSPESLKAALNTGADAVYLGAKSFSARGNAANFDREELAEAVRLCKLHGVRVYLALNTLIFDDERNKAEELISFAEWLKIDAVIAQDLSILEFIKKNDYKLKVHASTQMSINSLSGARTAKKLGFSRVVLARELSLREISHITSKCDIETEVFIHGALCVSVSGQCYMSAFLGGRSGNRGLCAQPCRLEFSSESNDNSLSLKDVSIITELRTLDEIGVTSAKIEGRMKRPEYVAAVTNLCFKIKNGIEPPENELNGVRAVFSRNGFTHGYFTGNYKDMYGIRTKNDVMSSEGIISGLQHLYEKPLKRRILNIMLVICANENIRCKAWSGDITIDLVFDPPSKAKNKPVSKEQIMHNLKKLGGTVFEAGSIDCYIEYGLYLSISEVNSIRRKIISEITERIQCNTNTQIKSN